MRTTVTLDDELIAALRDGLGIDEASALVRRALVEMRQRLALQRLIALGGSARMRQITSDGTVSNFMCGRAVKHYAAMALMKRSPKLTANCAFAIAHSRGGIFHSFSDRFKIKKSSLVAASSLGKWPLALTALRSLELSASMAFVV